MRFESGVCRNSATPKTFNFWGPNDQFAFAGYDDGKLRCWRIRHSKSWIEIFNDAIVVDPLDERENEIYEVDSGNVEDYTYMASKVFLPYSSKPYVCNTHYMQLNGFRTIVNTAVIYPRIFAAGVENAIYAFSPYNMGEDDQIEPNEETIDLADSLIADVYGRYTQVETYNMFYY